MRLKNKKTGEIIEIVIVDHGAEWEIRNVYADEHIQTYDSLAELNEIWEDAPEEPKEYWFMNSLGEVIQPSDTTDWVANDYAYHKAIGNYFLSREEAELPVRKLKAWKRLKDKGFRFTLTPGVGSLDITPGKFQIEITAEMPEKWFCCDAVQEDLDDCFGGEE